MQADGTRGEELARSIAAQERLSGVLWIVLGVLQVLAVVTVVAGVWNIYAASARFKIARAVEDREHWIPAAFEPLGGLITLGFINVVLGGVVGLVLVGLDVWIRRRVLENADVFAPGYVRIPEEPTAELPPTYLAAKAAEGREGASGPGAGTPE